MNRSTVWFVGVLVLLMAGMVGCARAARDTSGFAVVDTITVDTPFEQAWQHAKAALREQEFEIYTRDKRGVFVAYSKMKRQLFVPNRVQYTITLTSLSSDSTEIKIETVRQVYGVTLLTYPDWHDRKTSDNKDAAALLELIKAKCSGQVAPTPAPAEEAK